MRIKLIIKALIPSGKFIHNEIAFPHNKSTLQTSNFHSPFFRLSLFSHKYYLFVRKNVPRCRESIRRCRVRWCWCSVSGAHEEAIVKSLIAHLPSTTHTIAVAPRLIEFFKSFSRVESRQKVFFFEKYIFRCHFFFGVDFSAKLNNYGSCLVYG